MQSIKSVFYIGHGPSSSHTIGPHNAVRYILDKYPDADVTHIIEGADLAKVLNALYPQNWQKQLNALLRAVWEQNDELEARLVRHAVAEEFGGRVHELTEAKED